MGPKVSSWLLLTSAEPGREFLGPAGQAEEAKKEEEAGAIGIGGGVLQHVHSRYGLRKWGLYCTINTNALVVPSHFAASSALSICRHDNLFEYQCGFDVKLLPLAFQIKGGRTARPGALGADGAPYLRRESQSL